MTLVFKITTKEGHIRHFSFTEHKSDPKDYGNKTYISVVRVEDHENIAYLDVRYIHPYNFKTTCEDYIENYFGTRLESHLLCSIVR